MSHYGIDVSSNNAHPINWGAAFSYLKGLGRGDRPFAIIKVNEGNYYTNPDTAEDVAAARAAGFVVGGYLMDAGSSSPASEEALYKRVAGNLPQFDDDELPDGLTAAQYISHLATLIAIKPAFQYLNQSEVAEGFNAGTGLWLAQYNNAPGTVRYACTIHQYTSSGTIPGCAGNFDLNYWLGSEAEFDSVFQISSPPPPPPPPPAPKPYQITFEGKPMTVIPVPLFTTDAAGWYAFNVGLPAGKTNADIVSIVCDAASAFDPQSWHFCSAQPDFKTLGQIVFKSVAPNDTFTARVYVAD